MKLIIVVPDGMSDWRYPELDNRSPAEYAHTPGMDELVRRGRVGLVRTMYNGLPLGSLVGFLGILGFDPRQHFPLGRSVFEALALGLELGPADMAFRCNIVRVSDDDVLLDFTAGQISDAAAYQFLEGVRLPEALEIHHDLSYRNVLIYRDCPLSDEDIFLCEPHDNMGLPIQDLLPRYRNEVYRPFVEMMLESRRDGLMLWPWGAGRARAFPQVPYRLFTVTALRFLYGMGVAFGGQAVIPPGATGYTDSDLSAKYGALTAHIEEYDVGIVHCNAPDEEAHIHSVEGKVRAIEDIDRQIVSPLLRFLDACGKPYRLLLCPDHYTACDDGKHYKDPISYAVCGQGLEPDHRLSAYSEAVILDEAKTVEECYRLVTGLLE